jgi:hypothetical protein
LTRAERWLRTHVPDAPPPLLTEMIEALGADDAPVPDALAAAAVRLYQRVVRGSGGREDALPLLAGDALMTHAFQAQAELDPAGLRALAARWGPGAALRLEQQ